jgi:DNA-binding transcriptional MerR regulator
MEQVYFSLGDVAKLLRTTPHKIHYLLSIGQIPEPNLRIGSRRVWTMAEIGAISDTVQAMKTAELQRGQGGDHG